MRSAQFPLAAIPPPPSAAVPQPPMAAVPQPPSAAVPQPPMAAVPQPPSAAVPQPPMAAVPQPPMAAVPQPPMAAVPQPPKAAVPQPPMAAVPQPPMAAVPQPPSAAVPQPPMAAVPQPPMAAVPQPPSAAVPQPPMAAVPQPPSAAVPQPPMAAVPQPPLAAVPQPPMAAVPQPPLAAVPQPPSAAVPQPPMAAVPQPPLAAARQSPLVVAPACPPTSDGLNAIDGTGSGLSKSLVIPSAAGGLAVSLSETQQTRGYGRETQEIFSGNHPTSNPNLLSHSPLLAGLPSWNIPSASSSTWAGSTVTQVFVPQLDAVPARSVILPTAVWFDDRLERVVVPRVNATSSVPKGLQEEGSRQRLKPSFKRVKDKYLWRLPPSKEGIASELWRGVYWKHVDVHRYVSRRYFGGPPPVE